MADLVIPNLEDSLVLHADVEEEASLLTELQQLQASKNQQEEQLQQAAKAERCLRLRQEISDLRGQLDAMKKQRATTTAQVQPPPPVATSQVPPTNEWEDLEWELDSQHKAPATVVRKIELGSLHWGSSFLNDIKWILTEHTITQPTWSQQPTTASRVLTR
jgi:seryl-tRNA synthetase